MPPNKLTIEKINQRLLDDGRGIKFIDDFYVGIFYKHVFQCKNGHEWKTMANGVLNNKRGCPHCFSDAPSKKLFSNIQIKKRLADKNRVDIEFISRVERHDGKIGYGLFICTECGKEYSASIASVISGCGCLECRGRPKSNKIKLQIEIDEIHKKSIEVIGEYVNNRSLIELKCKRCQKTWEARPYNIKSPKQPTGCPHCRKWDKEKVNVSLERDEILFLMVGEMTGNVNSYSDFKCLSCGKILSKSISNAIRGVIGCSFCGIHHGTFDYNKPATLYYVKINYRNKFYYKIGITNSSIENRFRSSELKRMKKIKTWSYKKGKYAHEKEQKILSKHKSFLYKGDAKILRSGGMTEIFIKDVLKLDNKKEMDGD